MRPIYHRFAFALFIFAAVSLPAQEWRNDMQRQIDQRNAEAETQKARRLAIQAQEDAQRANARAAEIEARLAEIEGREQRARQAAAQAAAQQAAAERHQREVAASLAREKRKREAQAQAWSDAVRLHALPSTELKTSSIMSRQLSDGQTLVLIGQERHTFPTAQQAQAFIAQKKAIIAYWNSLTDTERKAEWDKQTERDFPWTKDPNDPRFVKMTEIHALFANRNDEYLNAPNYSHLLAGEAQRQYDSARNP